MVVNSLNFLLFFAVVFIVYYLPISVRNTRIQNGWLCLASFFFYGVADWRMIPLLLGAIIIFYGLGVWLKSEMNDGHIHQASHITTFGVVLGVGLLLYFKYLNFFAHSFAQLLSAIGLNVTWTTLNIILPVGVSFFTFKLISYLVEIHREHIEPSKDFIEFATYIAFFPTILSGPIDRPNKFIPQLQTPHNMDYSLAADGCRQILWGMFTKMCIADNLAVITESTWNTYSEQTSITLILVIFLYFVQMYADFDGYSNMAIGVGKLLGFKITRNFNHPFLARSMAEYWRRWHMSLTSWITDYVFMPLNIAFRNWGNYGIILAVIINLVVIGLWHGANWTYGLFGLYHGLLFVPLVFSGAFGKNKKLKPSHYGLPQFRDFLKMLGTFCLVSIGLVIFRAETIGQAFHFLGRAVMLDMVAAPSIDSYGKLYCLFALLLICSDWVQRDKEHFLQFPDLPVFRYRSVRWSIYLLIILLIITFTGKSQAFIYFQF